MVTFRRKSKPRETPFERFPEWTVGRRTLWPGDPCKVRGLGGTASFVAHVKNTETGAEWIDVLHKGKLRAAPLDNVKPLPKKRSKK